MEKKITDLLDCIQDDTVQLHTEDVASIERIKEATMKKISDGNSRNIAKRKVRRLSSMVAVAAVMLVMLTGVAFATNAFGIADYFKGFFGGLNDNQAEIIENIGTTDFSSVTSNGTTITPLAAISDENYYCILLELEAPVGIELKELTADEGYYQFDYEMQGLDNYSVQHRWYFDKYAESNKAQVAIVIGTQSGMGEKMNDGSPKTMRLENVYIQSPDKVYTTILEGVWEIDIGKDFAAQALDIPVAEIEMTIVEEISGDEYVMTLQEMSLSNISITYSYTYLSDNDWVTPGPGDIVIVMEDGSEVGIVTIEELLNGLVVSAEERQAEQWALDMWLEAYENAKTGKYVSYEVSDSFCFASPINLDEVAYIQFGSQQIFID